MSPRAPYRRRWLIRETIQTSAMDCGPAALHSLLDGHGLTVSYGRLRDVCSTSVDGTALSSLGELASGLGFEADERLVPADHLVLPEADALPAIAVVRVPTGRHFLVLWRRHGDLVQVMDPGAGRRWIHARTLVGELYQHRVKVPAAGWRKFAATDTFVASVRRALLDLGIAPAAADGLVATAVSDPTWVSLAALDAAARLGGTLVGAGALRRGRAAEAEVTGRFLRVRGGERDAIPLAFWSAWPEITPTGVGELEMSGAVVMTFKPLSAEAALPKIDPRVGRALERLREPVPDDPGWRSLVRSLFEGEGRLGPRLLLVGAVIAAMAVTLEALLLRRLYDLSIYLGLSAQRLGAIGAVLVFGLALVLVELQMTASAIRLGRRVEGRLRVRLLERLPYLGQAYFRTRLVSDLAQRAHGAHMIRTMPNLAANVARRGFEILFTLIGLVFLAPESAHVAIASAALAVGLPALTQRVLLERELRQQTHNGALSRHYLDALLGLMPIRAHGAQRAMRREHATALREWGRAGLAVATTTASLEAAQALLGVGLAGWLVYASVRSGETLLSGGFFLLVYWATMMPALGQELAATLKQLVPVRNVGLRLLDPMRAAEAPPPPHAPPPPQRDPAAAAFAPSGRGVAVRLDEVSVRAGGREILVPTSLAIAPGEHIAIVGSSGAGKSTLLALLQGWHAPSSGRLFVDRQPLEGRALEGLRRITAWVDPAVQLWNRTLLENILYGAPAGAQPPMSRILQEAELHGVLERLAGGLQSPLGSDGGLLSGGEAQRVRFARALARTDDRLVLLDEPFRGLDRAVRRELLVRARRWWREATLLFVTHDVGETAGFERVLVIEGGAVVEDAHPRALLERPGSRYRALLEAEARLRERFWDDPMWRRLRFEGGRLEAGEELG